jgi:hypothetical protein
MPGHPWKLRGYNFSAVNYCERPLLAFGQYHGMANFVEPSPLPRLSRYITTHDASGKAIVSIDMSPDLSWTSVGIAKFFLGYCINLSPVDMTSNGDVATYASYLKEPPRLIVPGGSVLQIVDMQPGALSPMH